MEPNEGPEGDGAKHQSADFHQKSTSASRPRPLTILAQLPSFGFYQRQCSSATLTASSDRKQHSQTAVLKPDRDKFPNTKTRHRSGCSQLPLSQEESLTGYRHSILPCLINMPLNPYHRATQKRPSRRSSTVRSRRIHLLKAAGFNLLLLQLLFLGLFCYIFGCLFHQSSYAHRLNIVFVDYDGGSIGNAFRSAYQGLKGPSFPTLEEKGSDEYSGGATSLRNAVCAIDYWAALFIEPEASSRLSSALATGGEQALSFDREGIVSYVWNEARYSAILDQVVSANLQTLSQKARTIYLSNTTDASTSPVQTLNTTDAASVAIFALPWDLHSINIQPTIQGSRLIYNTLVIILIMIQEFFYLGTVNGLYQQFKIYQSLYPRRIILFRNVLISGTYCLIGSLSTVGAIWAFRSGWQVNADQFVLSWIILWLFAHINFLTLDVFTVWLPHPYVPMALITWVMVNVASILVPFELSNNFYRWAYALPAHETYQVLTNIWSGGCNPQLYHALPVLLAFEICSFVLSSIGVYRRCHYAVIADEEAEESWKSKVKTAVAIELDKMEAEKEIQAQADQDAIIAGEEEHRRPEEEVVLEETKSKEIEEVEEGLRKEMSRLSRQQSRASRNAEFGPSFSLAFGNSPDE